MMKLQIKNTVYYIKRGLAYLAAGILWLLSWGKSPVRRDRYLFSGSGYGMLKFGVRTAILVPFVIYVISFRWINASSLLGNYDTGRDHCYFWAVLSQYTDPGNLPAAQGRAGYTLAILCAVAGIFCLSGLAVSSLISVVNRLTERWKQGMLHYDILFDKYVVIIGVNNQTAAIVKRSLRREDVKYVLIQTRQDVEKMRMRLDLDLDHEEEERVVYYYAERISREDIEQLNLKKAVEVYILGEDISFDTEEDHDAFNIECLEHVTKYMDDDEVKSYRKRHFSDNSRLTCHVDFEYQSTFSAFKATHIYQRLDKIVEFLPFNVHEIWAKKVLVDNFAVVPSGKKGEMTVQRYLPLDGGGITPESNKTVRLIIVGMNKMGTAFGVQAALLAHYPNIKRDRSLRTTITFIDDHAVTEGEYFRGRFEALFSLCRYRSVNCSDERLLYDHRHDAIQMYDLSPYGPYGYLYEEEGNFMDIQWEFIEGNIANDDVKQYISDIATDTEHNITTIAICFNHPQQSLATALYLPREVFNHALQVLTYQQNSFDILKNVANGEKDWKRYRNLYPFGMIDSCYTDSLFDDPKAKIVNFLFAHRNSESIKHELLTYTSTLVSSIYQKWESLSLVDKQSNIDMAESIPTKLRSMGISYSGNPEDVKAVIAGNDELIRAMAYSEHLRWLTERLFMSYRPLTDAEYEKLRTGEKDKEFFKVSHRAHLDICSNERLAVVDPRAPQNDQNNIRNLPLVLKCAEWLNFQAVKSSGRDRRQKVGLLQEFLLHDKGREHSLRYVPPMSSPDPSICDHSFWIADSPVTRWQWYLVTGRDKPADNEREMPAVNVTKDDVEDFLTILRKKTGLYFTLPNLAEWKKAASLSTPYLKGNSDWSHIICYDQPRGARPVRSMRMQQPNDLRIYDMLGNVWEWTRTHVENHPGCYYFCGGSFRFKKKECELDSDYWKTYWKPSLMSEDLGFRLVWKFEVSPEVADRLVREVMSKPEELSKEEQVKRWFNRHPMVKVDEGYFVMGTETSETIKALRYYPDTHGWVCDEADTDETPHHYVHIRAFQVGSVPVTQELWNIVMDEDSKSNPSAAIGDDLPQTNISYRTIVDKFLPRLKELTGRDYRLPTEAEWEYVAKGGHTHEISRKLSQLVHTYGHLRTADCELCHMHPYTKFSGSDYADEVAWTSQNTRGLRPVGLKKPISDDFKVYDMSGNIWEWCSDFYQSDIYRDCIEGKNRDKIQAPEDLAEAPYGDLGYITNPECLNIEYSAHVFRGGSWLFDEVDCRCTRPNYWVESDEDVDLGFRLALSESTHTKRKKKRK